MSKIQDAEEEIILLMEELSGSDQMSSDEYRELLQALIDNLEMKLAAAKND